MTANNNIEKPTIPADSIELANEIKTLSAQAQTLVIDDDDHYEIAALDLKTIKSKMRALDDQRKYITRPMDVAKKSVMDFFSFPKELLEEAELILKESMLAYQEKKERAAQQEEMRLKKRQQKEQERLASAAEEMEKSGDTETANAIIEQAATIPEAIVPDAAPKVIGIKTSTRWSAELISKQELIAAVAAGQVPDIALEVNMKFLNQQAVSLKEAFKIPGVIAVPKKSIAA